MISFRRRSGEACAVAVRVVGEVKRRMLLLRQRARGQKIKKGSSSGAKQDKGKQKAKEKDMSKVKCFSCGNMGHYVVKCRNKKGKKKQGFAAIADVDEFATMFDSECALVVSLANQVTSSCAWFIDNGASCHMTGVREHFTSLLEDDIDLEVVLGNNSNVKAAGMGTISFQRESLPPLKVMYVLHVPQLKKSLISISTLEDRWYEVPFRKGQVLLYPRGSSIEFARVIGAHSGRLYKLMFQPLRAMVAQTSRGSLCELWHKRMAHLHHEAFRMLREMVTRLPNFNTNHHDVCRGCALGKYTKTPFQSSDKITAGVLDLIHSDVCGPMSHVSLSGYEYYVTFIDDHSRRTWIYFLKTKYEVFQLLVSVLKALHQ